MNPTFTHFDWAITPADANDLLIGQLVKGINSPSLKENTVILFGLPFDGAVLGRKGAAGGPLAIREQARKLKAYSFRSGEVTCAIRDLGDAILPGDDVATAHDIAEKAARLAMNTAYARSGSPGMRMSRRRVVSLGGDHSLTFPCALPYLEKFGKRLAVVNLDAHLDIRKVPDGQPYNSGTSFGRLLECGLKFYTVIGARDFQTSTAYAKRRCDSRGRVVTASELFNTGAAAAARQVLRCLPRKCEAIYLSVDLDVADASVAPGVSAPTPGGLMAHQVFDLVRTIASDRRTIACDIVELAPALEAPYSDRTARLAAGCLAEMLF